LSLQSPRTIFTKIKNFTAKVTKVVHKPQRNLKNELVVAQVSVELVDKTFTNNHAQHAHPVDWRGYVLLDTCGKK
jgi:hypothetical protein